MVVKSQLKGLSEAMDKIPRTERRHESAAWLLNTVQNDGNDVKFWVSLETNFTRKTCTLEAETHGGVAKLGARFLLALTKNIRFLE